MPRRLDFHAVGHYARPDVFKLIVDESPQMTVASLAGATPPTPHTQESVPVGVDG